MTDDNTTKIPWKVPVVIELHTNVTPLGFDLVKMNEPTLMKRPSRLGMSHLLRANDATAEQDHE